MPNYTKFDPKVIQRIWLFWKSSSEFKLKV